MSTWLILANGFLKVAIWLTGVWFTYHRKRGLLCAGFAIAGYVAAVRALDDAADPHGAIVNSASLLGTVAAGLIVASFVFAQPGRGRPRHWTP